MYEKYFSLKHKPFELIPNPDFLFLSDSHKKAITYLDYGIKERAGFILLTGEIGSGKTTITRNMLKNLNGNIKISKINNTKVTSEQLISMINEDFGLDIIGKDKTTLLRELNYFLIEQYSKNHQLILLIDEAQNLNPDLLEEIRLLSNLETDRTKLLQIVLVGQPQLKKTLNLPNLKQLRQRISINYHITPLNIDETSQYIKHRLNIAGNPDVIKFKADMLGLIYQFSKGIPRLINILCDFMLLTTYVEGDKQVKMKTVREIVNDLESHDFWNEDEGAISSIRHDSVVPEPLNITREFADEITDVIKVRLIKLEEAVSQIIRNTSMDIKTISERITRMEEQVFSTAQLRDNSIADLLNRISKLEKMPIAINVDNAPGTLEISGDKSLGEQLEFLKRMLNYINTKVKKNMM